MKEIHTELKLENKAFEKPDSITTATICTKSGELAIPGVCDHTLAGNFTKTEYFAKGTAPTKYCTAHVKVSVCKKSGHLATPFCPVGSTKEVVYLIKNETTKTDDTPYIYPTDEKADPCPIHSEGSIAPPIGEEDVTLPPEDTEDDIIEDPANDSDWEEDTDTGTEDIDQPANTPDLILP